ncbi:MAG: nucleotidyltransferase domain-containing protein [Phycisphaerae bacterium]|nr:nucleotidyltransferase domain-containing protein [Phycisphaerae bacterium]
MIPYESWQARTADAGLLQRCKRAIRTVVPDADVILYGSRARGDANDGSDYDILVLVDHSAGVALHEQLISSISPLEDDGAVLTLSIHNRDLWNSKLYQAMPFHENVDREGVLL